MTHKKTYFGLQNIDENNTANEGDSEVDINLVIEQLKGKYLERLSELETAHQDNKPFLQGILLGFEISLTLLGQHAWLQEYPFEP